MQREKEYTRSHLRPHMEKKQKIQLCHHPSLTNVLGHCIKQYCNWTLQYCTSIQSCIIGLTPQFHLATINK